MNITLEQISTIEALLKLLERANDKATLAASVTGNRTNKIYHLTASEGYHLFDFLLIELQKKSLIQRIVSASHKIGIAKTPSPESANNHALVNNFIITAKWAKVNLHQLSLSEVDMIAVQMDVLIQYCEDYKIPKIETHKYVDESWEVMRGKKATESLLSELNLTVQPATRKRALKRK